MNAKPSIRPGAGAIFCTIALLACSPKPPAQTPDSQAIKFVAEGSLLYRVDAAGRLPILALDSATAPGGVTVAPSTWTPAPGSTFGVAARQFRLVAPAPAADWVAWESAGAVHDLLGLVPGHGGNIVVLDFFFDSSARELLWAPAGRYLAALYEAPSGFPELRLYDARTGTRLAPPWTAECRAQDACQVKSAQWTAATTIAVTTTARTYQTDVSQLK